MAIKETFAILICGTGEAAVDVIKGALITRNLVFILDVDGAHLYPCKPSVSDRHVIVDMDNGGNNIICGNEELVIDVMCGKRGVLI